MNMAEDGRVVTAKLPDDLVSRLDEVSDRIDRSKSWIVREAITEWLAEEQRRYELTLEAMKDIDEGRGIPHEEVLAMVEQRKRERRAARVRSAA
jgi:predicted transcriptional regulator